MVRCTASAYLPYATYNSLAICVYNSKIKLRIEFLQRKNCLRIMSGISHFKDWGLRFVLGHPIYYCPIYYFQIIFCLNAKLFCCFQSTFIWDKRIYLHLTWTSSQKFTIKKVLRYTCITVFVSNLIWNQNFENLNLKSQFC